MAGLSRFQLALCFTDFFPDRFSELGLYGSSLAKVGAVRTQDKVNFISSAQLPGPLVIRAPEKNSLFFETPHSEDNCVE